MLIEEDGRVEQGRFWINQAAYEVVVVPKVVSLFESTVRLLYEYSRQGGKVLWIGDFPEMVEGSREKAEQIEWEKFTDIKQLESYEELPQELEKQLGLEHKNKNERGSRR